MNYMKSKNTKHLITLTCIILFIGLSVKAFALVPMIIGGVVAGNYIIGLFQSSGLEQVEPVIYPLIGNMLHTSNVLNTAISKPLVGFFLPIFGFLWFIYLLLLGAKWKVNGEWSLATMLDILIYPALVAIIIVNYDTIVIDGFMNGFIKNGIQHLSSLILETGLTVGQIDASLPEASVLEKATAISENMQYQVTALGKLYVETQSSFWKIDSIIRLEAFFVSLVYKMINVSFFIVFVTGAVSIDILMMAFAPIFMLSTLPFMRPLLKVWFKSLMTMALIPVFASMAMAYTLVIVSFTVIDLEAKLSSENATVPEHMLFLLFAVGMFSLFLHIKSSTYVTMITNHNVTDFGQAAATAGTAAFGYAKIAGQKGLSATDTGIKKAPQATKRAWNAIQNIRGK